MVRYSDSFKQQIIDEVKLKGAAVNAVAQSNKIAPKTIYNWLEELSPQAELKALKKANRELKKDIAAYERLVGLLTQGSKKKR